MKKFFIILGLGFPIFMQGQSLELRGVLEEDLNVRIKINEVKKELKESSDEINLAMQNAKAMIALYEAKRAEKLEENKERDFQKNLLLSKINATGQNLQELEHNIEKIYEGFKANLSKVPPKLRDNYLRQMQALENTAYANSSEENLAKLKFLNGVIVDTQSYKVLDANTISFGLNTEFYKDNAKGDAIKLFDIIENNASFEILNLEVEKGLK